MEHNLNISECAAEEMQRVPKGTPGIRKPLLLNTISILSLIMATEVSFASSPGQYEILFTDSQASVLKTDNSTPPSIIANGSKLMQPFGIAINIDGELIISDTGCNGLIGINQASGEQRLIACGNTLGVPFGIAIERNGMVLAANAQNLIRVNPKTGAQTIVSSKCFFKAPIGVTVAENGDIYVVDALGPIIRVDATSGVQTLISSGGYLQRPQGIAVKGNLIYVTDVATSDMNFGVGRVIQVNARTGEQTILSQGQNLVSPVGIALDPSGDIIVGDPYSADQFDGGIIHIDKNTGAQNLIARGSNNFVNPRGVAILSNATGSVR